MRLALLAAVAALAAGSSARAADKVEGDWLTMDGGAKVRIAPCAGHADRLCGTIVWVKKAEEAQSKDIHNPDPKLRVRPILGLPLISDFKFTSAGKWGGGKIYDPRSGRTYASNMALTPDGALKVNGCIAMLCQAQTWRRP